MPRRYIDYPDAYAGWNMVSSVGAYITAASTIFFFIMLAYSMIAGRRAEANYWGEGATTLEWTVSSPPPFHSYENIPQIK